MKRYILLLISFSFIFAPYCFGQTGRAVARLASRTTLKPLNPSAFRTPLSSQLARQSFAQLLRSGEVAALSKPEQILLLTHKYVEENKQLPRTAISSDNQVVLSRNYSLPEKIETDLGNQFRRLLEDKNTPAEILQEARQLQADFSTKYQSIRIVNNLNKWLMTHDTWPRDQIKPEGRPLTEEEEYEIALARSMNNLLSRTDQNVVPDELLEQIALTRAFYDARYAPVEQEPQAFPNYDMDPPIEYENPAPSRPADFYISASLPRNPVTGRQEVLPTPTPEASVPFPTESIKPLIDHLINWLDTHEKWPSKPQKSFSKYTIKDIEEELLAEDVWRLQKQNPGLVDFVYSIWRDTKNTTPSNPLAEYTLGAQQRIITDIERHYENMSVEDMSFMLDHWYDNKEKTPSEFVGKMYRWTDEHQRWPEEIKWEAPFTYSMYEEILLAKELQYFVSLLISNPSWNLTRTLSRPLPYPKVNLERLRRLYQQYNKAN